MRSRLVTVALVGTLGLAGGALLGPGLAGAETRTAAAGTPAGTGGSGRLDAIRDALSGLVTDGTLTQPQADRVATTLDQRLPERRGRGGAGRLPAADVAEALGVTVAELRTARRDGRNLAQVAAAEGIGKDVLVDRLVALAEARLTEAVTAGRLPQARADERRATLRERITERVDEAGHGPGRRGTGPRSGTEPATSEIGTD